MSCSTAHKDPFHYKQTLEGVNETSKRCQPWSNPQFGLLKLFESQRKLDKAIPRVLRADFSP